MKRTALKRRSRIRAVSRKAVSVKELDRLCRWLVVELRDGNTCQRCGATAETHQIQWSHVVTRAAKSCRWRAWNSKAMCAGCHRWWASHPLEAADWWRQKFPDRALEHASWRTQRTRPPVRMWLEKEYLEQSIAELGAR